MTERYAAIAATPLEKVNLITLQLGSGCSATAVQGGHSIDTSMGLTPLEGLMMGTRTGDVDPWMLIFWGPIIALVVWGIVNVSRGKDQPARKKKSLEISQSRYSQGEITGSILGSN
jgi:uncharacterized membrane protein